MTRREVFRSAAEYPASNVEQRFGDCIPSGRLRTGMKDGVRPGFEENGGCSARSFMRTPGSGQTAVGPAPFEGLPVGRLRGE